MKFSEMTYTRPDPAASKQRLSALTAELKAAKSYEEARKVFLSQQELMSHISTAATLWKRRDAWWKPAVSPPAPAKRSRTRIVLEPMEPG